MFQSRSLFTLLALCAAVGFAKIRLPSDFPLCQVDAADFKDCLVKAINVAIPKLKDGEVNLGVPSTDPLHIDSAILDLRGGAIPLLIKGTNLNTTGLSMSKVIEADMDIKNYKLTAKSMTPAISIYFDYTATGKLLLLNIAGEGPAYMILENVEVVHEITGKPKEKKGKTYWDVTDYKVKINPSHLQSNFDNLFKGDPRVNTQVNKFLNDEWKTFWEQIKPQAENVFDEVFQAVTARVFDRVAFKDIFLGA